MIPFDLNVIASRLEGLEETIIYKLINRAQFRVNEAAYLEGKSGFGDGEGRSLFRLRLLYQEEFDAKFGRYCVPEERPFCSDLPEAKRAVTLVDKDLSISDYNLVNLTDKIEKSYLLLIKKICLPGDDSQYGSSVDHDVHALQAISRRIHYGAMFVAESKYRMDPHAYRQLIDKKDKKALMELLTRREVEEKILCRVKEKVAYVQAASNRSVRRLIDAEAVLEYYKEYIIPLTKEGQIIYLLNRGV